MKMKKKDTSAKSLITEKGIKIVWLLIGLVLLVKFFFKKLLTDEILLIIDYLSIVLGTLLICFALFGMLTNVNKREIFLQSLKKNKIRLYIYAFLIILFCLVKANVIKF